MNKIYLLFVCWFSFITLAFAQKMISVDNRWYLYAPGDFTGYGRGHYAYFFKDSIEIEGKYFYQAYTTSDSTFQQINPRDELYREENGIVYRRYKNWNTDEILYNFNLNPEDSITYGEPGFYSFTVKVLTIDSIQLLDKTKRKRLTLYNPQYPKEKYFFRYWIEGMGGQIQTFHPRTMYASDGTGGVSCFFHKEEYIYGVNPETCPAKLGPIIIDNVTEAKTLMGVQILQNTGDGNISFRLENPGRYQCKIYNTLGQTLKTQNVQHGDNFVSVVNFPKGIYFLQIYDLENQRQKTFKFLNH